MPEGQDKVLEAFEALQKALEEEQEILNNPAVVELFRRLRNDRLRLDRLRLVEWLLREVQKLAAVWREGKVVVHQSPSGQDAWAKGFRKARACHKVSIAR